MSSIESQMKGQAVSYLAKVLVDKSTWQKVLNQVETARSMTGTGAEKKAYVLACLQDDLADLSLLILNCLIELGVLFLRLKMGEKV